VYAYVYNCTIEQAYVYSLHEMAYLQNKLSTWKKSHCQQFNISQMTVSLPLSQLKTVSNKFNCSSRKCNLRRELTNEWG